MESSKYSLKQVIIYAIVLVFVIVVYQIFSSPMVITVSGIGEVSSPAESATLTFSLSSNSDSPTSAVNDLKSKIEKVKESLKLTGIPESNIFESQVALYPASALSSGGSGYQASVSMGLRTNQITNIDATVLSLYSMGANVVSQPVLEVGNKEELNSSAYNLALKNAKKQAFSIALKNFKFIKKIVLIQETTTPTTSTVTSKPSTISQAEDNISADAGLIKVTKVLSVSYKLW